MEYFVYKLKCCDGTHYTGMTNNLDKRLAEHKKGKGASYLKRKGKLPFSVIFTRRFSSSEEARRYEKVAKKHNNWD